MLIATSFLIHVKSFKRFKVSGIWNWQKFIYLLVSLFIYSFIYLFIYLFIHSFFYLSIYLFIYVFIYLFVEYFRWQFILNNSFLDCEGFWGMSIYGWQKIIVTWFSVFKVFSYWSWKKCWQIQFDQNQY